MKRYNFLYVFLTYPLFVINATHLHERVFPYVTAGDTLNIEPEKGLHSQNELSLGARIASLNDPELNDAYKQVVEDELSNNPDMISSSLNTHLSPNLTKNGLLHLSESLYATNKGLGATKSVSETFGPNVTNWTTVVCVTLIIPFFWFLISGSSQQLYKVFVSCSIGFIVHAFTLTWFLNIGFRNFTSFTFSSLLGCAASGSFLFPNSVWWSIVMMTYLILLNHLFVFWPIGQIFSSKITLVNVTLITISGVSTVIHFYALKRQPKSIMLCQALFIGILNAFIVTSEMAVLLDNLISIPSEYPYVKFFSPTHNPFTKSTWILFCNFILMSVLGTGLNYVRYCQFGIKSDTDAEANNPLIV